MKPPPLVSQTLTPRRRALFTSLEIYEPRRLRVSTPNGTRMPTIHRPRPSVAGVTVHYTDPFATPEEERSPVRRFRRRLPSAVTLWTGPGPAGLTVSSTLVADGDP